MEWLEPELDVGADEGLLRLPELELLDELELELPEFAELPLVPDDDALPEDGLPEEDVLLCAEPGRARATVPATTALAMPTAAVVVWTRPSPRWRAATAWATDFRLEVLMPCSLGPASGGLLGRGSEMAMSWSSASPRLLPRRSRSRRLAC